MSEYQSQKAIKPKVEDVILKLVKEEHKQAALDFVEHIRLNKMTPAWATTNSWKYNYKGKRVGYFRINDNGDWLLSVFSQYDNYLNELVLNESDEIKDFVNKQINNNVPCGGCMPGVNTKTVTKELKNICACNGISMENPNELYCEFAKKLIALRRDAILNNRVPKCNYIKPADRN